ncbi:MAG TPA: phosphatase PAP2 family protein [Solirubrobacteraceae bacterium]|nr:phosphatase PAP2 family protein [Solirubrobacteraceae bacterium]
MPRPLKRVAGAAVCLDRAVLVAARTRLHGARAERWIGTYSRLGEHGACWILLGATGAILDGRPGRRAGWLRGVRIVGAAYALNYGVKVIVQRRRPELQGLPPLTKTVSRLTFPSAHSTTSFAAARAYAGLVPAAAVYVPAFAFGLSRPYLGVHYPSDVVAGALLGTAIAVAWPPSEPRR